MSTPTPAPVPPAHAQSTAARWAVELKVIAATLMTAVVSAVVAVLNAVAGDSSLLGSTPAWAQAAIVVILPTALTFLAGYQAKHTPRPAVEQS